MSFDPTLSRIPFLLASAASPAPTLDAERILAAGSGITLTDAGPGGTLTLSWTGIRVRKNSAGTTFTRRRMNLIEGNGVTIEITDDAANDEVDITLHSGGGGAGGAPLDAPYVTLAQNSNLSAERILGVGESLTLTDDGAGANVTLDLASTLRGRLFAGLRFQTTLVETDYTLQEEEVIINVNAAISERLVQLPPANLSVGRFVVVRKKDLTSNIVNVNPDLGDTVNGGSGFVLAVPGQTVSLVSDGIDDWMVV